jgi:hypothetical protein
VRPTRRPSYARIAHKVGAVSREDLRRASDLAVHGGSLEERLISIGALDPHVATFVRAAWERDRATCGRCGRRTDGARDHLERGCACPRPAEPQLMAGAGEDRTAS